MKKILLTIFVVHVLFVALPTVHAQATTLNEIINQQSSEVEEQGKTDIPQAITEEEIEAEDAATQRRESQNNNEQSQLSDFLQNIAIFIIFLILISTKTGRKILGWLWILGFFRGGGGGFGGRGGFGGFGGGRSGGGGSSSDW